MGNKIGNLAYSKSSEILHLPIIDVIYIQIMLYLRVECVIQKFTLNILEFSYLFQQQFRDVFTLKVDGIIMS